MFKVDVNVGRLIPSRADKPRLRISGARDAYTYLPESVRKFPNAPELADRMRPTLVELAHLPSARQIAAELNRRGIKSATGAEWSSKTVSRLQQRLGLADQPGDQERWVETTI